MDLVQKYCDPDAVSEILYTELMTDIAAKNPDDVLIFHMKNSGKNICVSKDELMEYWSNDSGWNLGNCRFEGQNISADTHDFLRWDDTAEDYCNRYYKLMNNQYISDYNKTEIQDSPTQVWILSDSGEIRVLGRQTHTISEYNNPAEKIYKLCEYNAGEDIDSDNQDCPYNEMRYNGYFEILTSTGIIVSGIWKQGNPDGIISYRFSDGIYKALWTYKDGILNGELKEWYDINNSTDPDDDTHLEKKLMYRNGILVGTSYIWYENRNFQYTVEWKNGLKHGEEILYWKNGRKNIVNRWFDNIRNGLGEVYFENGQKHSSVMYINGQPDGLETIWFNNGDLDSQKMWNNGVLDGVQKFYYKGNKIKQILNYIQGQKSGLDTEYYENGGKKSEINYVNNVKDGVGKTWFENGRKNTEVYWNMGEIIKQVVYYDSLKNNIYNMVDRNGSETVYYTNEKIEYQTVFTDTGERNGTWFINYYNGTRKFEAIWEDDILLSVKFWDEDGDLITENLEDEIDSDLLIQDFMSPPVPRRDTDDDFLMGRNQ